MMRLIMMLTVVMFIVVMFIIRRQLGRDRRRNEGEGNGPVFMVIVVMVVVVIVMIVIMMIVVVIVVIVMTMLMMIVVVIVMDVVVRVVCGNAFRRLTFGARRRGRGLCVTARAAAGLTFFFFPLVTLLLGDQPFTVRDGDLIIVGMNFAEGEEPVTVPTVIDEGGLQRRFDADDFGEVDVAFDLFLCRCLYIKFLKARPIQNHHASFLGVRGID